MPGRRPIACGLTLLLALAGCQSAPPAQPQLVAVPQVHLPAPPAWIMQPQEPTLTDETLRLFSPSSDGATPPSGS